MSNGRKINLEELNSESFVKNAMSLDGSAFDQVCECIINPIVRFLHHQYEIPEADAEEIAADTLMKVYKALPRFDPNGGAKLSTWIFKIAINGARDYLRRQNAMKTGFTLVELDNATGAATAAQAATRAWFKSEQTADGPGEMNEVLWAFESLSQEDQDLLRQKQCMTYKDIASIERCSQGALRVRHARAVKRLRAAYKGEL